MKFLIFIISTLLFLNFAVALEKVPNNIIDIVDAFNKKTLDIKKDVPETKKMAEYLLALDDEDPSRTEAMALSQSYTKNPKVWEKALKEVSRGKTKQQIKNLKEIRAILKSFYKTGNE
jgi:hypothetical protein